MTKKYESTLQNIGQDPVDFLTPFYIEGNDTFVFVSENAMYVATATGETEDRPEDHPAKNNVVYEAYYLDNINNVPELIGIGREAKITGLIMSHYIDNFFKDKANG